LLRFTRKAGTCEKRRVERSGTFEAAFPRDQAVTAATSRTQKSTEAFRARRSHSSDHCECREKPLQFRELGYAPEIEPLRLRGARLIAFGYPPLKIRLPG
jgi:hypothetical protein